MRPVDQVVKDLKKAETEEATARAVTSKLRAELEEIYTEVSKALGKKNQPTFRTAIGDVRLEN